MQVALEAHLRRMRQKQSVSFVSAIRKRYLDSFGSRGRLSVRETDGCIYIFLPFGGLVKKNLSPLYVDLGRSLYTDLALYAQL